MTTLALIHTGAFLASVFTGLCLEAMPHVEVFNIVDESLIKNTITANKLTPQTARRVVETIRSAEEAGADAVLVTCSSIGPAVEAAQQFFNIPVFRVDIPMVDQALCIGPRIGVVATLSTTLQPTVELVKSRAAVHGKMVEVIATLCDGAFQAVATGDTATHDRMVAAGIRALMPKADVIVLAQASMARAADTIPAAEQTVPILSSPRSAVAAVQQALENLCVSTSPAA